MNLEQDERRAEKAQEVLQNEIYREAWSSIRDAIITKLESEVDPVTRNRLCDLLSLHRKAQKNMEAVVTTGQMATIELERKRTLAERATQRLRRVVGY